MGFGGAACLKHAIHPSLLPPLQLAFWRNPILSHFVWHFQSAAGLLSSFFCCFYPELCAASDVFFILRFCIWMNTRHIYISLVHCCTWDILKEQPKSFPYKYMFLSLTDTVYTQLYKLSSPGNGRKRDRMCCCHKQLVFMFTPRESCLKQRWKKREVVIVPWCTGNLVVQYQHFLNSRFWCDCTW